jgi:hypothetical protein
LSKAQSAMSIRVAPVSVDGGRPNRSFATYRAAHLMENGSNDREEID